VGHYGATLLRRELGWVVENIREGAVELANIVKKCDALDAVTRGLVDVGGFTEDDRVGRNTTHVSTGLGIVAPMALSSVSKVAAPNRSALMRMLCSR